MDDLTNFLKGGGSGLSNLEWLDVNAEEYRQIETLPKQNLDIAPDLKAIWTHEDLPASRFVPNTGGPRTMGDMSQAHGPLRATPEVLARTARLALTQSTDIQQFQRTLTARFDLETLRANRSILSSALAERGLLGNFYLDARDFTSCAQGSKQASDFARKFAKDALFVQAKTACGDCVHRKTLAGKTHCSVFHKELVLEVPYTESLADAVEQVQAGAKLASSASPKERIRQAYLAQTEQAPSFSGHQQYAPKQATVDVEKGLIAISNLTKKRDAEQQQKLAAQRARPVVATLQREMLKGRSREELVQALRLVFDPRDLTATRSEWEPIFRQAGLYGAVYSTQDSFEDCREGADFLSRHGSQTRAIVAGEKCGSCIFSKIGRCLMYGKPLIASSDVITTPETVAAVLDEHRIAGRLSHSAQHENWGSTPAEQLKRIHEAAMGPKPATASQNLRANIEHGFYGQTRQAGTSDAVHRDVIKVTAEYLNEGLYGDELLTVLRGRFTDDDIRSASSELQPLLAEQGLQGIKYIDPSAYGDYGQGCKEASRKHRSRKAVRYAKVGEKCGSCVHQTRPGFCSALDKQLVVEPPYVNKLAEQAAVLASGKSTEVSYESLMNNGLSMMQEYQIQHGDGNIELTQERQVIDASVEFGAQGFKL